MENFGFGKNAISNMGLHETVYLQLNVLPISVFIFQK